MASGRKTRTRPRFSRSATMVYRYNFDINQLLANDLISPRLRGGTGGPCLARTPYCVLPGSGVPGFKRRVLPCQPSPSRQRRRSAPYLFSDSSLARTLDHDNAFPHPPATRFLASNPTAPTRSNTPAPWPSPRKTASPKWLACYGPCATKPPAGRKPRCRVCTAHRRARPWPGGAARRAACGRNCPSGRPLAGVGRS